MLKVQSLFEILVRYSGLIKSSSFLLCFVAPVEDQTGCSDYNLVENCSEFSSTPNTSTHTTPEPSPTKKRRVEKPQSLFPEDAQPSSSGRKKSGGKDLSLLMTGQTGKCMVPKDSLYFREMARTKENGKEEDWKDPSPKLGAQSAPQDAVTGTGEEKCS